MGLLLKIGSSRTFFALTSDIVGLPGTDLLEILLESMLAKPEMEQIGDTAAGQGCTRQRINAIHRVLAIGSYTTFHQLDLRFGALLQIIDLFARPLCLPRRIVDLATKTGRFRVLVES